MHPGCDKAMSTTVIPPQIQHICPFCRQDQLQNELENIKSGNKETERKNGERKKEKINKYKTKQNSASRTCGTHRQRVWRRADNQAKIQ